MGAMVLSATLTAQTAYKDTTVRIGDLEVISFSKKAKEGFETQVFRVSSDYEKVCTYFGRLDSVDSVMGGIKLHLSMPWSKPPQSCVVYIKKEE